MTDTENNLITLKDHLTHRKNKLAAITAQLVRYSIAKDTHYSTRDELQKELEAFPQSLRDRLMTAKWGVYNRVFVAQFAESGDLTPDEARKAFSFSESRLKDFSLGIQAAVFIGGKDPFESVCSVDIVVIMAVIEDWLNDNNDRAQAR